jgi:prevent-host-death family protein
MREITVSVSEFRAKCLRLIDAVETKGDRIVITKRGRPIARIEPVEPLKPRLRGTWEGKARITGDIVYFSDNPWEVELDSLFARDLRPDVAVARWAACE